MRLKDRSRLRSAKVPGEAAGAEAEAAAGPPEAVAQVIREGGCTEQEMITVEETACYRKKMPSRTFLAAEGKTMPGFKASKDRLTLLLGANA